MNKSLGNLLLTVHLLFMSLAITIIFIFYLISCGSETANWLWWDVATIKLDKKLHKLAYGWVWFSIGYSGLKWILLTLSVTLTQCEYTNRGSGKDSGMCCDVRGQRNGDSYIMARLVFEEEGGGVWCRMRGVSKECDKGVRERVMGGVVREWCVGEAEK